jgi:glycosyltransferase involved in cell wall biosynthesis
MPVITTPADRARFGYFGELFNCLHANEIADIVCIVRANNAADTGWMLRLSECNAHYAIRGAVNPDVFKPFIKGFTAAHCGVPIIVASGDQEARHYLGAEYPFVVGDTSVGSVREHIERFAAEYATSRWKSAIEMMRSVAAKSSRQRVESELRALLDAIW